MLDSETGEALLPVLSFSVDVSLRKPRVWVSWNFSDFQYGCVPKASMAHLPRAWAVLVLRAEGTQGAASGPPRLRDVTQRPVEIYRP